LTEFKIWKINFTGYFKLFLRFTPTQFPSFATLHGSIRNLCFIPEESGNWWRTDLAELMGDERAVYVQDMFSRIAHRYDLMNRLMTGGQDHRWRRITIKKSELPTGGLLLDLGAGTGDLAREALLQQPGAAAVAADFTLEMMRAGKRRAEGVELRWCAADALHLPFPEKCFDALVSGFLLRNVTDIQASLHEQVRVLRPGGRWVSLDTTRPRPGLLYPLVQAHLHFVIPALGHLLTGQPDAYRYLPESTENFVRAEQLARRMIDAGLQEVGFKLFMFGTVAIHWGRKGPARRAEV
jgi:demethylmenaquinone methyltransferase/2-methoxy-6-polyprenyl-1,4-benzoquinol methylase